MRVFNLSVAGVVASVLLFGSVGSVFAQDLFEADPIDLQFERDVRSTYIVRLSGGLPAAAVNTRANEVANRFGGRVLHVYSNTINGFAIRMPSVAVARMTRAGGLGIVSVTQDQIVTIDKKPPGTPGGGGGGETTTSECDQRVPWGVARVTPISDTTYYTNDGKTKHCTVEDSGFFGVVTEPNYASATKSRGTAPSVCVIDTGVDQDNLDLNVNVGLASNFTNDKSADDLHGHGTHVAGIIGALASDGNGVVGVAPNARIISVKVLNRRGSGSYSDVIAGVDSIATGSSPVCAIANMSLGGSNYQQLVDAVRCAAAATTTELKNLNCNASAFPSGITFTLAAGNEKDHAVSHSPANASSGLYDNIHTIAAMGEGNPENTWASFSNYGKSIVDYIQPGVAIESTYKGGDYKTWNGTSMAAPHMAGLVLRNIVNGTTIVTDGFVPHSESGSDVDYPIAINSLTVRLQ